MNTLTEIALFLISTVFNFFIIAVMLRFALQWVKADFYNPICQFLIKVTNPLLLPLRRVVPGYWGLDFSAIVLMLLIQIAELLLIAWLMHFPLSGYLILEAILRLATLALNLMFFAILIRAVMSWFQPNPSNPLVILLIKLTEPVLKPLRKRIPLIGGFDVSPIVALVVIQVVLIVLQGL